MARCIAHRGGAGYAPENTLAAIERTLTSGSTTWIEVDLHRTRDGHLVVAHDMNVLRTTDHAARRPESAPAVIADLELAELRELDAGGWFDPAYAGERIPTLSEVLELDGIALMLELKDAERYPGIEKDLARQLRASQSEIRPAEIMVWSFDVAPLRRMHRHAPEYPLGMLARRIEAATFEPHLPILTFGGVWPELRAIDVQEARALGLPIAAATLNSVDRMTSAVDLGADIVITDYPDVFSSLTDKSWPMPGENAAWFDREHPPVRQSAADGDALQIRVATPDTVDGFPWCLRGHDGARLDIVAAGHDDLPGTWAVVDAPRRPAAQGPTTLALHDVDGTLLDLTEY
ncbi:hypothetical protein EF847_21270 [Actinobacteria bacterium YIM 96077]|uniref:GP-PDE domain-containing protein n=1 Tax=Phytoactinopolyspora halophila TaxID=1981511 RepID=A0A329QQY5_9ACTN|nr:glycerophosphodiester phosphodiesterase family protein [Phytoactinopolyspora halophila]AYY14844.1 hypothetical protein EF847_21270 [Actinobacteria bacterium YIM 96077]RAW13118.1 hypothetical protein DPM12_13680 [Phytoactinopolyspora halophila]